MKSLLAKVLPTTVLCSALLLSGAAWSMDHRGGGDHDPARMVTHMTERLDLSESQQEEIGQLLEQSRENLSGDKKRLEELRGQLQAQRKDFDSGAAQKQADEIGEMTGRIAYEMASTQASIYQLLNEEQREEFDEFSEKREERRGKWQKRGKRDQD